MNDAKYFGDYVDNERKARDTFERRMEILFYFQRLEENRTTAEILAEKFQVSRKTIGKDLNVLTRYIPFRFERGRYGGIIVDDGWKLFFRYFSTEEVKCLLKCYCFSEINGSHSDVETIRVILGFYTSNRDRDLIADILMNK